MLELRNLLNWTSLVRGRAYHHVEHRQMTYLPRLTIAVAIIVASFVFDAALVDAADVAEQIVWTLPGTEVSDADLTDARTLIDKHGYESWFLLRTTSSKGAVASRTWAHDGRYAPLDSSGSDLFGAPIKGAIFRTNPQRSLRSLLVSRGRTPSTAP